MSKPQKDKQRPTEHIYPRRETDEKNRTLCYVRNACSLRPNPVSELLRIFRELLLRFQKRVATKQSAVKETLGKQADLAEKLRVSEEKPQIKETTKAEEKARIAPIRNPLKNPVEQIRMAAQRWKQQVQLRQRIAQENELRELRIRRSQRQENSTGMRMRI